MPDKAPFLSAILPFHNESENLDALFARVEAVLATLGGNYEIISIDDGSTDATFARLAAHHVRNPRIKAIRFARNFGKENAVSCGLQMAKGDAVILMDGDLQDPPETILELVAKWKDGAEMVYAIRQNRDTDGPARRFFTRLFYWLFQKISEVPIPPGACDFRLLDRKVVNAVNALPERGRFMKGLMSWPGFRTAEVGYIKAARHKGTSNWSPLRLVQLAMEGFLSFSNLPLRIWTSIGFMISLFALGYLVFLFVRTVFFGIDVPGYASLMVTMLMLGGIQLIGLGVLAEYIGRIFTEVKQRPLYIISESRGLEASEAQPEKGLWLARK